MAETAEPKGATEDRRGRAEMLTETLGLVIWIGFTELGLMPGAEAMLVGFSVASAAGYWVPPTPPVSYGRWMLRHILIVSGLYLSLFKIPARLKPRLPLVLAYALPILALCAVVYLLEWRRPKKTQN